MFVGDTPSPQCIILSSFTLFYYFLLLLLFIVINYFTKIAVVLMTTANTNWSHDTIFISIVIIITLHKSCIAVVQKERIAYSLLN